MSIEDETVAFTVVWTGRTKYEIHEIIPKMMQFSLTLDGFEKNEFEHLTVVHAPSDDDEPEMKEAKPDISAEIEVRHTDAVFEKGPKFCTVVTSGLLQAGAYICTTAIFWPKWTPDLRISGVSKIEHRQFSIFPCNKKPGKQKLGDSYFFFEKTGRQPN